MGEEIISRLLFLHSRFTSFIGCVCSCSIIVLANPVKVRKIYKYIGIYPKSAGTWIMIDYLDVFTERMGYVFSMQSLWLKGICMD